MVKIAKSFFENNFVKLAKTDAFEKSDLFLYLKLSFGADPIFADKGFIKVIDEGDHLILSEHIYYDYFVGRGNYYITIPGLNFEHGTEITNTAQGLNMSKYGYAVVEMPLDVQNLVLEEFPNVPFKLTPLEQGMFEPYGTFKFNQTIWKNENLKISNSSAGMAYWGIKRFLEKNLSFSSILKALDDFDLNILKWRQGRSMEAHNAVDYKSFVNLITYNTNHCQQTRELFVGEHDWYDVTFNALFTNNWEALMNINQGKDQKNAFMVETSKAIIISGFNPKFYHEVGEMKGSGDLYVCTSNMSFKTITEKFSFNW